MERDPLQHLLRLLLRKLHKLLLHLTSWHPSATSDRHSDSSGPRQKDQHNHPECPGPLDPTFDSPYWVPHKLLPDHLAALHTVPGHRTCICALQYLLSYWVGFVVERSLENVDYIQVGSAYCICHFDCIIWVHALKILSVQTQNEWKVECIAINAENWKISSSQKVINQKVR